MPYTEVEKGCLTVGTIGLIIAICALGMSIDYEVNKITLDTSNGTTTNTLARFTGTQSLTNSGISVSDDNIMSGNGCALEFNSQGKFISSGQLLVNTIQPVQSLRYLMVQDEFTPITGEDNQSVIGSGSGSNTFAANFWKTADCFEWYFGGYVVATAGASLLFTFQLNDTTNSTITVPIAANILSGNIRINAKYYIVSSGSDGQITQNVTATLISNDTNQVTASSSDISFDFSTTLASTFDILVSCENTVSITPTMATLTYTSFG